MSAGYQYQPLPLSKIRLTDPFWNSWQRAFIDRGLKHQWEQCEETGRVENFRKAIRNKGEKVDGYWFNDSDIYKWAEAASYALQVDPSAPIRSELDEAISLAGQAQMADGYLNTTFQCNQPQNKWLNLNMMHEIYIGGHLLEGAVAHFKATGDRKFLDIAVKFADLVESIFGPDKRKGYCGHEEFELGAVALSEATGDPKYRELARWMIDMRGTRPSPFEQEFNDPVADAIFPESRGVFYKKGVYDGAYSQDDKPLREQDKAVGHSVRAMYFYCGAADAYGDGSDKSVFDALSRIWDNMVYSRMYVTGGIGSSGSNEGFTEDYDLPNRHAYSETCASIGLLLWAWRMNRALGDASAIDILERALYNAVLSGVGFGSDTYYYVNPLESLGNHLRQPWFSCACCPPNIARLVMSIGRYLYGVGPDSLWINIPAAGEGTATINGAEVKFVVESNYPWEGSYSVRLHCSSPVRFALKLRKPGWADKADVSFNGKASDFKVDKGYLVVEKEWADGDVVTVDIPTALNWLTSNPKVTDNIGRVAVQRGPLVYCLEEADLGSSVFGFAADTSAPMKVVEESDPRLARTVTVTGTVDESEWLHRPAYVPGNPPAPKPVNARFVPYFSWANRQPGTMQVWVRRK